MYTYGGSHFGSNAEENTHNSEILPGDANGIFSSVARIRCLCGFSIISEPMVQCKDPQCGVLQHGCCVLISEDEAVVIPPVPPQFYCEICRINRADPFWVTVAQPLCPVRLTDSGTTTNGANRINIATNSFHLERAETNLLKNTEYDVQVWCILLNDRVQFRIHWPLYAKLLINGIAVQTHNRPNTHPLGANGRDDGPLVKAYMREGANTISLSGCDSRIFSFGVRIVKRRTVEEILSLISNQPDGEKWEDALARVRHCIGGDSATESTDGDLEVVMESITLNIRCPISGSRIRIAARFRPCTHMGCFDLGTFVELTQRTKKWQCPTCLKNYSLENICIDPYFSCITSMLQYCEDDVTEVEFKPDGCWRVKDERCTADLAQWHYPDGTIHMDRLKDNTQLQSDKTCNESTVESVGALPEKLSSFCQNMVPLGCNVVINDRDGGYRTSSHDRGGLSALPPIMSTRPGSAPHFDNDVRPPDNPSALSGGADMIILSDSDDENEKLVSSGTLYQFGQAATGQTFQNVPYTGGWDSRLADSTFSGPTSQDNCYSNYYYNNNFKTPNSALASGSSVSSQFLVTGPKAIDSSANPHQRSSLAYPSTLNDNFLAPLLNMLSSRQTPDILQGSVSNTSYGQACITLNDCVDSCLRNIEHSNSNYQLGVSNFNNCDQWSSFSNGSNICYGVTGGVSAANGMNTGIQVSGPEVAMSSPMITGLTSILNDHMVDQTANSRGFDNTLYFSHQRDNASVHSYSTQQSLRPCFMHTAPKGDRVDSRKMMHPVHNSANLVHGFPTSWAGQQMHGEIDDASLYYKMPTDQGNKSLL